MIKDVVSKNDFVLVDFLIKTKRTDKVLVPNVGGIAREMTGSSQIMLILKRFFSLDIFDMLVFGINNISFLPQLLKMDYAAGVKVLCELEILKSRQSVGINEYVLHNQMVDMAIALKNIKVVKNFLDLATKYKFRPGLMSYNPTQLIEYLSSFGKLPENLSIYTKIDEVDPAFQFANLSNINFFNLSGK